MLVNTSIFLLGFYLYFDNSAPLYAHSFIIVCDGVEFSSEMLVVMSDY